MAKWDQGWKNELDDSLSYFIEMLTGSHKKKAAAIMVMISFLSNVIESLIEDLKFLLEEE